jgi:hypothetical protein
MESEWLRQKDRSLPSILQSVEKVSEEVIDV